MKTARRRDFKQALLVGLIMGMTPLPALADQDGVCTTSELKNPVRVVLRCPNGLVVEAETRADLRALTGGRPPETVSIKNRAVLVETPKGNGAFQVKTPHAIASVRGTLFAVDATSNQSSVLVLRGQVAVTSLTTRETVVLSAGQGVVIAYDKPVQVKTWPEEKISALLARFAR
ncbi:FecR domain-containing protein [Aliisedimentitalea sp. MJ-SS2]|uniref:FecR domain-containing protein n=1 Tax=Aliisedimentitalea sp. MJ-SS2 TaxID=3049795 RepID=UPI00292FAEA8|nr:FecR domain-containing protein [Alisedimentitalea sp. MJ-SS2]